MRSRRARNETGLTDVVERVDCRASCGACCIAPSISSPIPGMPDGKPAGIRCVQLADDLRCRIFGSPDRPAVCSSLRALAEMCGDSVADAMRYLDELEELTRPRTSTILPTTG